MKRFVAGVAGIAMLSGASVLAQGNAKAAEAGKKLFTDLKCTSCHVIAGKGGTMTKQFPLDGVGAKMSAADIKKWLITPAEMEAKLEKKPVLKMSSKKYDLKDADVDALLAYILTLKTK